MEVESLRCIAVDWSGANDEKGQLVGIWMAVTESGSLTRLTNGFTREEIVAELVQEIESGDPIVIGIDFSFSFPEWYLRRRKLDDVRDLWALAEQEGEDWLGGDTWPFWGRSGKYRSRPNDLYAELRLRKTEEQYRSDQPKSVFQVAGSGQVGTGSVRGLPKLADLKDAGAAIWPFDDPETSNATVVEIFPRLFYGQGVTNNWRVKGRDSRRAHLEAEFASIRRHWRDIMVGSPDAFDAGVSALAMSANVGELRGLRQTTNPRMKLEGSIWFPSSDQAAISPANERP